MRAKFFLIVVIVLGAPILFNLWNPKFKEASDSSLLGEEQVHVTCCGYINVRGTCLISEKLYPQLVLPLIKVDYVSVIAQPECKMPYVLVYCTAI